jgi:hypothetical protein
MSTLRTWALAAALLFGTSNACHVVCKTALQKNMRYNKNARGLVLSYRGTDSPPGRPENSYRHVDKQCPL